MRVEAFQPVITGAEISWGIRVTWDQSYAEYTEGALSRSMY